ncbi:hypothetical protein ACP3V3_01740 [Vibrio sp. PNB22_3_1]
MAKILNTSELSETLSLLINNPEQLGALEEFDTHKRFIEAVTEITTDFIGGEANVYEEEDSENGKELTIAIHFDDRLACPQHNPYKLHDAYGFEDEIHQANMVPLDENDIHNQRISAWLSPIHHANQYLKENCIKPPSVHGVIELDTEDQQTLLDNADAIFNLPTEHYTLKHLLMNAYHSPSLKTNPQLRSIPCNVFLQQPDLDYPFLTEKLRQKIQNIIQLQEHRLK